MAISKQVRKWKNNQTKQVDLCSRRIFDTINNFILLPAGMQLRREAELTIWHQFSRALARSHWRDMDVILLEKNVQMDANIRAAQIELDAMGMMIKNKRGAPITNPFLLVIDTL